MASKADMERYLSEHPPVADPRYQKMRKRNRQWGRHLYINFREEFNRLFETWWKANPGLWDGGYKEPNTMTDISGLTNLLNAGLGRLAARLAKKEHAPTKT